MRIRTGHRVVVKGNELIADHTANMQDPSYRRMWDMLSGATIGGQKCPAGELHSRALQSPPPQATVTGTRDNGDYANLRFDDGFECSCQTSFLERAPK